MFTDLGKLFLIEDFSRRTFCSDDCIVAFHAPLVLKLDEDESEMRSELGVSEESILTYKNDQSIVEETLSLPDEVYKNTNALGHEYYHLFKSHRKDNDAFNMIIICYMFQGSPSFVFFQTVSQEQRVLNYYRVGERVDGGDYNESSLQPHDDGDDGDSDSLKISADIVEELEQKKSSFLAKLLSFQKNDDIPTEKYPQYESHLEETLDVPDEVYFKEDEDGDGMYTYVKALVEKSHSFFYIVVCMNIDIADEGEQLIPIFSFPTKDSTLCQKLEFGEKKESSRKLN
jgi:hypothetical protein